MTFQDQQFNIPRLSRPGKMKFLNFMTFKIFHELQKPCDRECDHALLYIVNKQNINDIITAVLGV